MQFEFVNSGSPYWCWVVPMLHFIHFLFFNQAVLGIGKFPRLYCQTLVLVQFVFFLRKCFQVLFPKSPLFLAPPPHFAHFCHSSMDRHKDQPPLPIRVTWVTHLSDLLGDCPRCAETFLQTSTIEGSIKQMSLEMKIKQIKLWSIILVIKGCLKIWFL